MIDLSIFSLEGKVALVTGGSRGIGEAVALGFADAGADVIITSRTMADLDTVAEKIRNKQRKCLPIAANVGKMEDIEKIVNAAVAEFGKIDILVNNAGASGAASPLEATERLWDKIMNLNLKGLYFLSQRVARTMKEHGEGNIINVASVDGFEPEPQVGIYSISKAGVIMATRALALDLAEHNIRVNCVAPGSIRTKMLQSLYDYSPEAEAIDAQRVILKRIGKPEELVGIMIYLASQASSYVTAHTFLVDGGYIKSE